VRLTGLPPDERESRIIALPRQGKRVELVVKMETSCVSGHIRTKHVELSGISMRILDDTTNRKGQPCSRQIPALLWVLEHSEW
jgi:hypothetical protein